MLEPGSLTSLPAKYRITLALSIALLLHTLAVSLLPMLIPDPLREPSTLRFTLVQPGSEPTPRQVEQPEQSRKHEVWTPDPVEPTQDMPRRQEARTAPMPAVPALSGPRLDTPAADPTVPAPPNQEATAQQAESTASQPADAGLPVVEIAEKSEPAQIVEIAENPQETNPYLFALRQHIAQELYEHGAPSLHRLSEPVSVAMELHLMSSGALVNAVIQRSSGHEELDRAAYRAALSASPYPEPPSSERERKRFQVEVIFSPKRL